MISYRRAGGSEFLPNRRAWYQPACMPRKIFFATLPVTICRRRNCRTRLPVKLTIRWLLPHIVRMTLPVPVTLNRLVRLFLVFIFGMADSVCSWFCRATRTETAMFRQTAWKSRRAGNYAPVSAQKRPYFPGSQGAGTNTL